MPTVLHAAHNAVVRRLDRHDLAGLADLLPQALGFGGDVDAWFGTDA